MQSMVGKEIPSFPNEVLNDTEKAQDLVFAAYEMHPGKGKINISKALLIDHTCIEAYEYLASIEEHAIIAIIFYEKAIALGKQRFGGEFLKENKGHFWLIHETRAYMRCLQQYADCLYDIGEKHKCIAILEELIKLNPNDNQGVRDNCCYI